jgi:uncharacterized protein
MSQSMPIFDVDTHWSEPPNLWTSRAPEKYKGKVFEVRKKDEKTEAWFVAGKEVAMIGPAIVAKDMSKKLGVFTLPTFDQMSPACSNPLDRVKYMDSAGVIAQVVYPNVIGFGGQALMRTFPDDAELRLWHVQTYNDALAEMQKESNNRLLPMAALPLWDIEASTKELERIAKMGLRGIAMSDKPADFGQPTLTNKVWERFWATCQDLNLPVNFHIGSGSFEGEVNKWWDDNKVVVAPDGTVNGPLGIFTAVNNFMNNFLDIMNLILTGMLDRYPKLKFVSVESGCGWIPFVIQATEHMWKEMMSPAARAKFSREPREMFIDQIFATIYLEDEHCVDSFIGYFGPDNLMLETDFPHPTSMYPHPTMKYPSVQAYADSILRNHSEETKRKVLYQNAEKLYGVKLVNA